MEVPRLIEGSLEVKHPTIWTDEKQRWEEAEKKVRRESQRGEADRIKERKCEKVAKRNFQRFVAPGGGKIGWLKWRVRSHVARFETKRKVAFRCCPKCMSKSKFTKHTRFRALLEFEMSKRGTPLWFEEHVQVKMYKAHQVPTTKKCTPVWREAHFSVKSVKN